MVLGRDIGRPGQSLRVVTLGELVSVAWNGWSTQTDGRSYEFAAVELFRVRDGKIVEIWNSKEAKGHWLAP